MTRLLLADTAGVIGGIVVAVVAAISAVAVEMIRTRHTATTASERSIEAKTLAVNTSDRVDKVAREEGAMDRLHHTVDDLAAQVVKITTLDAETKKRLVEEIARATAAVEECERDRVADRDRIAALERDVAKNMAALHRIAPGLIQRPTDGG